MKKIMNSIVFLSAGFVCLGISSCYKKFDPKSYAPPLNIGGYTSTKEISPANLVGYWAFDGSLIDSVSGETAVNTGTTFTTGFKKQALQGAVNAYALATPSAAITGMQSFTITCWVNSPKNANGIAGLVNLSNNDQFWGNIDMFFENPDANAPDNARFRAHITNNGGTPDHWVSKDGLVNVFNKWTSFVVSFDGPTKTFKFYLNGSLIVTDVDNNFGTLHFVNSGKLVFGTVQFMTTPSLTTSHGAEPWAGYLTGQLDEVRIYNKALSDNEVNSLVKLEGRGK